VTYILNEVKTSGCNGFDDAEIYSMAVHVIDEPTLEIGKPIKYNVVVNHHIELTEEEKAQQRELALKRFHKEGTYLAILDTIDGLQVERVFLVNANAHRFIEARATA